jgi:hypothetical protein
MRSCYLAKTSEAASAGINHELLEAMTAAGYFIRRKQILGTRAAIRSSWLDDMCRLWFSLAACWLTCAGHGSASRPAG